MTFNAFTDEQWQAIRVVRDDWPEGTDWRGKIEQAGREVWEWRAERKTGLEKLRGKSARERKKVDGILRLIRQLQKAWADSSLDDTDLPDPGLELRQERAELWLYDYETWVTPYAGQSDPIREHLYWRLMSIWIEAGGELSYSRKKDDPGTPYRPLVDFLTRTLEAILSKTYQPSSIAKIIDRHRPEIAHARGMRRRRRGARFA
jgi:hypothetical protein